MRRLALTVRGMEPGLLTLAKLVGTLLFSTGIIPFVFLMLQGDRKEPKDDLSGLSG